MRSGEQTRVATLDEYRAVCESAMTNLGGECLKGFEPIIATRNFRDLFQEHMKEKGLVGITKPHHFRFLPLNEPGVGRVW